MSAWTKRAVLFLLILGCCLLAIRLNLPDNKKSEVPQTTAPAVHPQPRLLPPRQATAESPLQSWERLLAEDGDPNEDRAALADVMRNYLEAIAPGERPPLGTNGEITRALTDETDLGKSAIPRVHPAIIHGELVDRWGSPWHFHQLSAGVIEVRSAGPDRKLFTKDDVAK